MESVLKALQQIQSSMKELQAQISAQKYGHKLPGMEDEVEGMEGEEGVEIASGGMATRPVPGEMEVEESEESPTKPWGGEETPEEEDAEEGAIPGGKKPSAKIMAIKALIRGNTKKL